MIRIELLLLIVLATSGCDSAPEYQLTPAILEGDVGKVQQLLDDGVDVNWRPGGTGLTPLSIAASHGQLRIAGFLIKRGADPNLTNALGEVPLLFAAYNGDLEMCRLLIAAGADVNWRGGRYQHSPLEDAIRQGHRDVEQLLRKSGAKG